MKILIAADANLLNDMKFINMKYGRTFFYLFVFQILLGCFIGAGTLGGFNSVILPTSKIKLDKAMDSLFVNHPGYRVPQEWKEFDSWESSGYDFLQSEIFYFKDEPQEMYYVTYIGDEETLQDTTKVEIAVWAVNRGDYHWFLNDEFSQLEKQRIERRFDSEIVSKLKHYLKLN